MPESDHIHTIYIIGIILVLAPIVQSAIFFLVQIGKNPEFASISEGAFYANALFQTAGIMMILYVAYKKFMEGLKSARVKPVNN